MLIEKEKIKDDLIMLIERNSGVDHENINFDTDLIDELNYDSISIVKLIVDIEEHFQIQIDNEFLVLEHLTNINEIYDEIVNKLESDG